MDTIFALATAPGKSGIAVIRVSGPDAWSAGLDLAGPLPQVRRASLRNLVNSEGLVLDRALVIVFSAGHSFTGEDIIEFHIHGGTAVIKSVLAALGDMDALRLANPGEFTRQALENERLDLAQVEGLADLINAETESQRLQAQNLLSGALGEKAETWRSKLIRAAALLEATIDFADEDVPVDVFPEVCGLVSAIKQNLSDEIRGTKIAERIRDGFEVAIVGPPNAGKSTLLNALAGRDAAITSEFAGTTRDVIEVRMDLNGLPVTFLDTAGLRNTTDKVEALGVSLGIKRAEKADLRVFLGSSDSIYSGLVQKIDDILISGKSDLDPPGSSGVSGKTGQGVSGLIARISNTLEQRSALPATATRERHRMAIEQAVEALDAANTEIALGLDRSEFAAEEIRRAIRSLDSLVGLVDVENILDEIFSSFCIGK